MKNIFVSIARWFVVSSVDPRKWSLTVRATGVLAIPYVLSSLSAACGFGLLCIGVDEAGLNQLVESVAAVVEGILFAIGGIMFIAGFIRKVVLSIGQKKV